MHFDELSRKYNRVYVLNLLSQSKLDEDKLSQVLINTIDGRDDRNIQLYNYDFHRELAGDNFGLISGLMNILRPHLISENYRMFIRSRDSNKTYWQGGVVRTQHLDEAPAGDKSRIL